MLYLIEIKKAKSFVGYKTNMKLLAYERNDHSWHLTTAQEILPADELNEFNDGTILIVNLNNSHQIQVPPKNAHEHIINIFQSYSRLIEKSKLQEEEMELWRQSLTHQSEELNRRQEELNHQLIKMGMNEEELLNLQDENRRLKALAINESTGVNSRKYLHIKDDNVKADLIKKIRQTVTDFPESDIHKQKVFLKDFNNVHSQVMSAQNLSNLSLQSKDFQDALDALDCDLTIEVKNAEKTQGSLSNARQNLASQEGILNEKRSQLDYLALKQANHDKLIQSIQSMPSNKDELDFDLDDIESMPLGELEQASEALHQELDRLVNFVDDQEEELDLQHKSVEQLEKSVSKVEPNNSEEHYKLQERLNDEQEKLEMLNKTLVGQRRTLQEKQNTYQDYCRILKHRHDVLERERAEQENLNYLMAQIEAERELDRVKKQQIETDIAVIQQTIQQFEEMIISREQELALQQVTLEQKRSYYLSQQLEHAQVQGEKQLYARYIEPLQDDLQELPKLFEALDEIPETLARLSQHQQLLQEVLAAIVDSESASDSTKILA